MSVSPSLQHETSLSTEGGTVSELVTFWGYCSWSVHKAEGRRCHRWTESCCNSVLFGCTWVINYTFLSKCLIWNSSVSSHVPLRWWISCSPHARVCSKQLLEILDIPLNMWAGQVRVQDYWVARNFMSTSSPVWQCDHVMLGGPPTLLQWLIVCMQFVPLESIIKMQGILKEWEGRTFHS